MFLLWAGAAISISEIYTGGLIAPLGFQKGLLAIIVGHIIGTALLRYLFSSNIIKANLSYQKRKHLYYTILAFGNDYCLPIPNRAVSELSFNGGKCFYSDIYHCIFRIPLC